MTISSATFQDVLLLALYTTTRETLAVSTVLMQ